eukprot:Gb_09811 [translate_table: standard]
MRPSSRRHLSVGPMSFDGTLSQLHVHDAPPAIEFGAMDNCREETRTKKKRELCSGCDRVVSVCLCDFLPPQPFRTCTSILILQHPHQLRQKLATVPLLQKCLQNSQVIIGRRLQMGSSPILDALWHKSDNNKAKPQALLLFPGEAAVDLENWVSIQTSTPVQSGMDHFSANPLPENDNLLLLVVIDGTWQHAREMVKASMPFLSRFIVQICLPYDLNGEGHGMGNSDLILRKEPFGGCISTMEAVARSLRILEPQGVEIEQKLLAVLRAMVAFQFRNVQSMKSRPRLLKKDQCQRMPKFMGMGSRWEFVEKAMRLSTYCTWRHCAIGSMFFDGTLSQNYYLQGGPMERASDCFLAVAAEKNQQHKFICSPME